jgi:hypothetical protein
VFSDAYEVRSDMAKSGCREENAYDAVEKTEIEKVGDERRKGQ